MCCPNGKGSFNHYVTPFWQFLTPPPPCHRLSHPADPPIITSHLTNLPPPGLHRLQLKQHTEMCCCYHCMLIQSFFHFFWVFCQNFVRNYISSVRYDTIRYDTIGEFNVDWKAEYSALSSTRSQKKKLKQPTPVPL